MHPSRLSYRISWKHRRTCGRTSEERNSYRVRHPSGKKGATGAESDDTRSTCPELLKFCSRDDFTVYTRAGRNKRFRFIPRRALKLLLLLLLYTRYSLKIRAHGRIRDGWTKRVSDIRKFTGRTLFSRHSIWHFSHLLRAIVLHLCKQACD